MTTWGIWESVTESNVLPTETDVSGTDISCTVSIDEVVVADGQTGGQDHDEAEGEGHDGQGPRPLREDVGGRVEAVLGVGEVRLHLVARPLLLVVAVRLLALLDAAAALGYLRKGKERSHEPARCLNKGVHATL